MCVWKATHMGHIGPGAESDVDDCLVFNNVKSLSVLVLQLIRYTVDFDTKPQKISK